MGERLCMLALGLATGLTWSATAPCAVVAQTGTPPPPAPLSLDVELRARAESRGNADFDAAVPDGQSGVLSRLRVGVSLKLGTGTRAYVQVQDSRRAGDLAQSVTDVTTLHQAYLEMHPLGGTHLTARVGRQHLAFGENRLVSASNWSNVGRVFDAVRLTYRNQAYTLDYFSANVVRRHYLAPTAPPQGSFHGLYWSTGGGPRTVRQLYALLKRRAGNLWTVGARLRSPAGPRRVDAMYELAYQMGRQAGRAHVACAGIASVGYTVPAAWSPRLGLEYAAATGDGNPDDKTSKSFEILYPTNHPFYGLMDNFSWRNTRNVRLSLSARPSRRTDATVDFHTFRLAAARDAWYSASGARILQDRTGAAGTDVGSELDVQVTHRLGARVSLLAAYGHFFAGPYVKHLRSRPGDSDWGCVQTTYQF